jgi:hypothetical protein
MAVNPEDHITTDWGTDLGVKTLALSAINALEAALPGEPFSKQFGYEFKKWCTEHNVFYYCRCGEDFSWIHGTHLAREAKADYVLMESLS